MSVALSAAIRSYQPPQGGLAMFWLGNSSWAIKLDSGKVVYIDPMLSTVLARINNWHRLQPVPFAPAEADCDLVLITHGHADHLDPETVPDLFRATGAHFVSNPAFRDQLLQLGVAPGRHTPVDIGEETVIDGLSIRAVKAFHMHARLPQPHAMGYVLRYGDTSVYHAGDTAYIQEVRDSVVAAGPVTVALLPINGKRCCLTTEDAAFLAQDVGASVLVPMHYGMFIENNGDPYELQDYMRRYGVEARLMVVPFLCGLTVTGSRQEHAVLQEVSR